MNKYELIDESWWKEYNTFKLALINWFMNLYNSKLYDGAKTWNFHISLGKCVLSEDKKPANVWMIKQYGNSGKQSETQMITFYF